MAYLNTFKTLVHGQLCY